MCYRSRCAVADKRRRGGLAEGRHDNANANALYATALTSRDVHLKGHELQVDDLHRWNVNDKLILRHATTSHST